MTIAGADGRQLLITRYGRRRSWWCVLEVSTRECLTGGMTKPEAVAWARAELARDAGPRKVRS
jgi:hypothetical protein